MHRLVEFCRKPIVYRTVIFIIVTLALYMEVIAPLTGLWSPHQPTMLDGWIMRGR